MEKVYNKSANLPIDQEKAYEMIDWYFRSKNYRSTGSSFPHNLQFEGGVSSVFSAKSDQDFPRTLSIDIEQAPQNICLVKCRYELKSAWKFPSGWDFADNEIFGLVDLVMVNKPGPAVNARNGLPTYIPPASTNPPTYTEKIIERQIVKVRCRYCGTLNNDGNSSCESCGARL